MLTPHLLYSSYNCLVMPSRASFTARSRGSSRSSRVSSINTTRLGGTSISGVSTIQPSRVSHPASSQIGSEDEDIDHLNEVVMAVDLNGATTVGCCYYVAREEKLYFMEDMKLGGPDVVDAC